MNTWHRQIQRMVDEVDACIQAQQDESLTLEALSHRLGYSACHVSHKFKEISGMAFRDYLRGRRLAFALQELRDTDQTILDIAVRYGFSSHEAFTRAFRDAYGLAPSEYRNHPAAVSLRTLLSPLDCFLMETGASASQQAAGAIQTYFVTIPAHKFLHIRNYQSVGYWDFWQKQSAIPGQDCETICGLLHSIPGKLDDLGGAEADASSGQLMAFVNEPAGRICSWGIPLAECYGARLSADYAGPIPEQMQLMEVPEGEYIVFEHGPFDFGTQNAAVEAGMEAAMRAFDYQAAGVKLDTTQGRVFYFYHDCQRHWKYVRPIQKV